MRLHVDERGDGAKVAVLLHGMMGSSESWWRVTPELVERGYRVLAIDLPGHGLSDRNAELTIETAADSIVATVNSLAPNGPSLAMGHSFGGLLLAAAAAQLRPELAIYVDAPFTSRGGWDRTDALSKYETDRRSRTVERLRATHPHYSDTDCVVEAVAAERFDPATAAAVAAGRGGTWLPESGSIVLRAAPSRYVTDNDVADLTSRRVDVRDIPGAAHSIWTSHLEEFRSALPEVFQ